VSDTPITDKQLRAVLKTYGVLQLEAHGFLAIEPVNHNGGANVRMPSLPLDTLLPFGFRELKLRFFACRRFNHSPRLGHVYNQNVGMDVPVDDIECLTTAMLRNWLNYVDCIIAIPHADSRHRFLGFISRKIFDKGPKFSHLEADTEADF
jgi:hypothetical protein